VSHLTRRLAFAAAALLLTVVIGTLGFLWLGAGRWTLGDCAYMTLVSATTVGYGETLPEMDHIPGARAWAVLVILLGVGTFGFAASMVTAWIVETDLTERLKGKRIRKMIDRMQDHMIVCGVGSTGRHVVREMVSTRIPVVAIDVEQSRLDALVVELGAERVPFLVGDATEDELLERAGVSRARGVVTALPDDKDNLFVVVTAREMNPRARIVARGHDARIAEKLRKAGAHAVVSPNLIGGMRLASEMIRPHVVEFLDEMLRDRDKNLRIEEVQIPETCDEAGKTIREARLRQVTDALVLAIRDQERRSFAYNPHPDTVLEAGSILVVLGTPDAVARLKEHFGST